MSINSALLSGVSGLIANSAALGAISDNIANLNTVGYKENDAQFEDLVTAKATTGNYNSGGVQANVRQLVSQQGQFQQTSSATDLAISGSGFFVVSQSPSGLGSTQAPEFTRAGSFVPDSAGNLQNTAGLYLQGWLADSTGTITTNPSDLTKLSTINVASIGNSPNPTTTAALNANLNSTQAVSAQAATYSASTNSMAAYDSNPTTGVKPDYSTQLTIYDAKGGQHAVQLDFLKSSTPNQWNAEIVAVPASDVQGVSNGQLASGVVQFNPDGTLDTANTTLPTSLSIGASAGGGAGSWSTALGLPAQTIALNLAGPSGSFTQYANASTTNSTTVDGGPAGALTNVQVDSSGFVIANFSNGATRKIAQVALATFPDPDALTSVSGNAYMASFDSGSFNLKAAGDGGAGSISPSTLESSTVDLSTEFTGLITTQRAYSAASKIITTADQMLQELISTKQ